MCELEPYVPAADGDHRAGHRHHRLDGLGRLQRKPAQDRRSGGTVLAYDIAVRVVGLRQVPGERVGAAEAALLDEHEVGLLAQSRGDQIVRRPAELGVGREDFELRQDRALRRGRVGAVRLGVPAGDREDRDAPDHAGAPPPERRQREPRAAGHEQPGQEGEGLRHGRDPVRVGGPAPHHHTDPGKQERPGQRGHHPPGMPAPYLRSRRRGRHGRGARGVQGGLPPASWSQRSHPPSKTGPRPARLLKPLPAPPPGRGGRGGLR